GPAKATGKARYSFDINRPGMLQAMILRSPHAHAKIKSIDTAEAEKSPGVKAIHLILKEGAEVYWAGDEVLGLAADTEEHAHDGLRKIKIEYEVLPFLVKEEDALEKDLNTVPPVGPAKETKNLRPPIEGATDNVEEGFKKADAVVEGSYGM